MSESQITYETRDFWVCAVGARGYEVYKRGACASTRVASIGHGDAPRLGIARAIAECQRRQSELSGEVFFTFNLE